MKPILIILFFPLLLFSFSLQAQLEKIIVEKYYISDANDATDTIGGKLDSGSVTYRIYIDMQPGYQLLKVYGDKNHALKIASTAPFFNNIDRGQSFGYQIGHLNENTVALDTWITLGQVNKNAAKTYCGVLKTGDPDGSIVGGAVNNNDGGSAGIAAGLLANNNPAAGIPLTSADGMELFNHPLINWVNNGFIDMVSHKDSTIFGSVKSGSRFISYDAYLSNNGTIGVNPDSNQVIVAQLTTKGELTFELNIMIADSTNKHIFTYVSNDSILLPGEIYSRYLKYPFQKLCGCPDPNYLQYKPNRDCDNLDSCKSFVVLGCMDRAACNFNPDANFSVPNLCCYPGLCHDMDISAICQTININEPKASFEFKLYPNPAQGQLNITISSIGNTETGYEIVDSFGKLVLKKNLGVHSASVADRIDISELSDGLYLMRLYVGNETLSEKFIKN